MRLITEDTLLQKSRRVLLAIVCFEFIHKQ
jgi:hypothetical protein